MDSDIISEIFSGLSPSGIKLDLSRIKSLMNLLDNPQDNLKFIHVAGTNGKGSTCAMIASILRDAGYRVGKFISPHLEKFNERISINEDCIEDAEIQKISQEILKPKIKCMVERGIESPTHFEVVAALGFYYFYQKKCDIVILETGLGGKYDATNIIKNPLVSVITSISYDHIEYLGKALPQIAAEKAGIIKPDCPVVTYPQDEEVYDILRIACKEKQCRLITVNPQVLLSKGFKNNCEMFDFEDYKDLEISLLGEHQLLNAAVAIKTIEAVKKNGFSISTDALYTGLKNAKNIGRFEILRQAPHFVIDGAHNPNGMKYLKKALLRYYPGKKVILVLGILSTKDYKKMVDIIVPLAEKCILTEPISANALPCEDFSQYVSKYCKDIIIEKGIVTSVKIALDAADSNTVVCCCGSLYFIGTARKFFAKSC